VVGDELKGARLIEIFDGENTLEHGLQAMLITFFRWKVHLQKLHVALLLDVDKVGYIDYFLDLTVILTQPKVLLDDGRHVGTSQSDDDG
jgi:hypothetical protein